MFEDELIGTTVDGRYRVDRLVGQGGFGTVYAAQHLRLGAQVALKIPRVDQVPQSEVPELIKTFLEEGRMLKELRHPNIVAALDVGVLPADASGLALPYLVLEWCQGASLKEWLAAHPGARSREEAWSLMRPVFDAIAYAHTRGLAHRDIKPANVLLEPTDGALTAKVIDFGIAKRVDPRDDKPSGHTFTSATRNAFTPRYAAPEQLAGLRTGPWSDVYALALVVLEVLAGRAVFTDDGEARARLLQGEALSLDELGFNVGDWNAPLTRALARSPADRFQDATELLRALDAAATAPTVRFTKAETAPPAGETSADLSVAPASHTIRKRPGPSIGRRPGFVAAAMLTAAMLAVGVLVTGTFALLRPPSKPSSDASPKLGSGPKPTPSVPGSSSPRPALSSVTADVLAAEAAQAGFVSCVKTSGAEVASVSCADLDVALRKRGNADTDPRAIEAGLQSDGLARTAVNGRAYRYLRDGFWSLEIDGDPIRIEGLERSLAAAFAHDSSGREKVYSEPPPPVPARLAHWQGSEVGARLHTLGIRVIADIAQDATGSPVLGATASGLDGTDSVTALLYRSTGKAMLAATMAQNAKHYAYALDGDVLLTLTSTSKLGRIDFLKKVLDGSRAETVGDVP